MATADKDRIPVGWQRGLRAEANSKLNEIKAAEQQANAEENSHDDFPFGENPPAPTNPDTPINPEDFLKDLEADTAMPIDENLFKQEVKCLIKYAKKMQLEEIDAIATEE